MTSKPPTIARMGMRLNTTVMKRERTRSGMSQKDLAEKIEVERSYIAHLENGTKQPTVAVLERIAANWSMPVCDLTVPKDAAETLANADA